MENKPKSSGESKIRSIFRVAITIGAAISFLQSLNSILRQISEQSAKSSAARTYAWRYGTVRYKTSGSGSPYLLVHPIGPGHSLEDCEKTAARLAKTHTVYQLELIGHGASAQPAISYSKYLFASQINDFIRDVIKDSVSAQGPDVLTAAAKLNRNYFTAVQISEVIPQKKVSPLKRRLLCLPLIGETIFRLSNLKKFPGGQYLNAYHSSGYLD